MNDTITQTILSLLEVGITNNDTSIMIDVWELLTDSPPPKCTNDKKNKSTHYNTWTDSAELAEFETEKDAVLYNPLTPRNRQPVTMVEVSCSKCGRVDEINADFYNSEMMQTYRCSNCMS